MSRGFRSINEQRTTVSERWSIDGSAHFVGKEFRNDAQQLADVVINAGPNDEVTFERCKFIDGFKGIEAISGKVIRIVDCEFVFERSETHPPSVALSQYGLLYANGSHASPIENLVVAGCKSYGPRLDNLKVAGNVIGFYFDGNECGNAGVSPSDAALYGTTAQEGGAVDLAFGGQTGVLKGQRSMRNYGVAAVLKTHQSYPSSTYGTCGDVQIIGLHSEGDVYGITHEPVDTLDYPSLPENPGVRTEAMRFSIIGGIVKDATIGAFLNGTHLTMVGTQFHGCGQEGVIAYVHCRDNELANVMVVGCSRSSANAKPGVTIKGARGFTWDKGLVDGNYGGVTYHRTPIEVYDYDGSNLCDDIHISMPRLRNWVTTASPPVSFYCTPTTAIVDHWGTEAPTSSPGRHGGKASTYRNASGLWVQTGAANTKNLWKLVTTA